MTIVARKVSVVEHRQLDRLSHSTRADVRIVRRALVILHALNAESVAEVAHSLSVSGALVRRTINRFDQFGLEGLGNAFPSSRPPKRRASAVASAIAADRQRLEALGLPVDPWTMEELEAEVAANLIADEHVIRVSPSRLEEFVKAKQSSGK